MYRARARIHDEMDCILFYFFSAKKRCNQEGGDI